jgi:Fic family protein
MQTFRNHERILDPVPGGVVQALGELEHASGKAAAQRGQHRAALKTLVEVARIQSTEASNAIEDITAPPARLRALMDEMTAPANRSEAQIAGYRSALDLIHSSADAMPFSENVVKQLHQTIYSLTNARHAGEYKTGPNDVTETLPDGTVVVRFRPVSPLETRTVAMPELHRRFDELQRAQAHHPLLLLGAYVFDLLMIHPFQDGNGRTARLVTLLLLYQSGHEVGRYISLERIINDTRETYYEALQRSTLGWHDGQHTIWPWMEYLMGTLLAAYKEFEQRLEMTAGYGTKQPAVRDFIRSRIVDEFSLDDIRSATPASDPLIKKVLQELRAGGVIEVVQRGRYARYRRLHTNF